MKRLFLGIIILAIFGGAAYFVSTKSDTDQPETTSQTNTETSDKTPEENQPIKIIAAGDMLPHDTVNLRAETEDSYDYTQFFSLVPQLKSGDVRFCNQESPSAGESFGISGYPSFNAPIEFSRDLERAGCNLINLANNHIADRGQSGIDATLNTWGSLNTLAFTGANSSPDEQNTPKYFTVRDKKFAFIAFTDLSNNQVSSHSVNMFSNDLVSKLSAEAAANADFVIASAHWGVEDSSVPTSAQQSWAQLMADSGVDLILGSGPHVLQPVDTLSTPDGRTVPVWYSLGNFLSTQLTIEQLTGGVASIELDPDSLKVTGMTFMPTYMHYEWTAEQAANEDLLARDGLLLHPLDQAESALASSLFDTNVADLTKSVEVVINQNGKVNIVNSSEF